MLAWWLLFLSRSSALRAGPQPMTMVANPRLSPSLPFAPASATVSQKPVFTTTAKPELTPNELRQLEAEGSVKRQRREGRVGSAMIAVDTDIPASEVWRQIRDVSSWSQVMRGVRSSKVRERRRGVVRAGFSVTKLRIPANIVLEMPRDNEGPVRFYLDKSCTNIAVDSLDGYWLVEPIDETSTRVWLCADVAACKVVPRAAIDYVASKALGRATAWLSRVDDDRVWRLDLGTAAETSCCGAATNRGSSLPSSSASECRSPDAVGEKGVHRRLIKEATFRMGSDRPKIVGDFEGPSRLVSVKSFEIDAYEATNAEFGEFVDATGYVTDSEKYGWSFVFHLETDERERLVKGVEWWVAVNGSYWREPRGPGTASESNLPAVQVSWNDAEAFCRWRQGRLPTEAEWEMAARDGRSGELFPWGNELLGEDRRHRANVWQGDFPTYNNEEDGFAFAAPVGSFPPQTQSGLHDMIGNVWEWVQDDWNDPSFTSSATTRTTTTKAAEDDAVVEKVKKGGSYLCHRSYCYRYRSAARHKNSADSASSNQGVRCAYDV